MTRLESIIRHAVEEGLLTELASQANDFGSQMARELMNDPATKAHYVSLMRKAIDKALTNLDEEL